MFLPGGIICNHPVVIFTVLESVHGCLARDIYRGVLEIISFKSKSPTFCLKYSVHAVPCSGRYHNDRSK